MIIINKNDFSLVSYIPYQLVIRYAMQSKTNIRIFKPAPLPPHRLKPSMKKLKNKTNVKKTIAQTKKPHQSEALKYLNRYF